jgi:hypothetical protein
LLLSWLAMGCTSDPQTSHSDAATGYPRTCASVADCFPVYEGPIGCCGARCPNTAIRQDVVATYMSNLNAASLSTCLGVQSPCTPPPACPDGRVACVAGVCQLETAVADAATE